MSTQGGSGGGGAAPGSNGSNAYWNATNVGGGTGQNTGVNQGTYPGGAVGDSQTGQGLTGGAGGQGLAGVAGNSANNWGGGGGGSTNQGSGNFTGGVGRQGYVVIRYTPKPPVGNGFHTVII